MQNLMNDLTKLFQKDDRIFVDGKLLKNKLTELALKLDSALVELLLSDKRAKENFFIEQTLKKETVLVFDKDKFISFVNNKEFLPDSFTSFKNKIGLMTNGDYLKEKSDVVLVWAYKDCVLEGGQDKEDQKRDEIFYNETLAPDEIDRLFEPKGLTNFKKYDVKGEHKVTDFNTNDNLIIKGNNLLTLHCLKKKYRGKVKLIYIDPPYNMGGDDFGYNDRFKHSSWLTFMRNRLEVAKELLSNNGGIFVQIDHHEIGYLNVLMDEIFGVDNKVQIISIKTASPAGFKTVNPGPIDVTEYLLFYTKNKAQFAFKKAFVPVGYNTNYNLYVEKSKEVKDWKFIPIKQKVLQEAGFKDEKEAKKKYGKLWNSISKVMIEDFAFDNASNVVSIRDPHKPTKLVKELMEKSKKHEYPISHKREDGSDLILYKGGALAFYSNKIKDIDGQKCVTELLTDFWDHISWAGIAKEGRVKLKNGKKPEKLIKQLIELATEEGDLVLDYHLGSGTTASVAHKMKRQYIGIEQLNYGDNDSFVRLKNVVDGDGSGISKAVNWQGGGSFIYAELMEWNEKYMQDIKDADTSRNLLNIYEKMKKEAFFRYDIELSKFDETEFVQLPLKEQKQIMCECLDKNHLYVNLSEIDDATYKVGADDKKLNKEFYKQSI
ncbi:MAG: site-specific DNA-methyltransferase [Candidatus Omnitrophota bacterium]